MLTQGACTLPLPPPTSSSYFLAHFLGSYLWHFIPPSVSHLIPASYTHSLLWLNCLPSPSRCDKTLLPNDLSRPASVSWLGFTFIIQAFQSKDDNCHRGNLFLSLSHWLRSCIRAIFFLYTNTINACQYTMWVPARRGVGHLCQLAAVVATPLGKNTDSIRGVKMSDISNTQLEAGTL